MSQHADPYDLTAPPRFVLSDETIAAALKQAANPSSSPSSSSRPSHTPESRTSSSGSKSSRSKSSRSEHYADCGCTDCYNASGKRGSNTRTTINASGDRVEDYAGDEVNFRYGIHMPPDEPKVTRRDSERSNSSRTVSRTDSGNKNIYQGINRDGDRVEEYAGSSAPEIRTHYDAAELEKVVFPGEGMPAPKRIETSQRF